MLYFVYYACIYSKNIKTWMGIRDTKFRITVTSIPSGSSRIEDLESIKSGEQWASWARKVTEAKQQVGKGYGVWWAKCIMSD